MIWRPGAQVRIACLAGMLRAKTFGVAPTTSTLQTLGVPPSVEWKAISRPSGDQTGEELDDAQKVSCRGGPPSIGITKMFAPLPSERAKAICRQSGDTLGLSSDCVPVVSWLAFTLSGAVPS